MDKIVVWRQMSCPPTFCLEYFFRNCTSKLKVIDNLIWCTNHSTKLSCQRGIPFYPSSLVYTFGPGLDSPTLNNCFLFWISSASWIFGLWNFNLNSCSTDNVGFYLGLVGLYSIRMLLNNLPRMLLRILAWYCGDLQVGCFTSPWLLAIA